VIDAGSSYLCQCEPVAHFGLGGDTAQERSPQQVTIRWPDGNERTVSDPAAQTTHEVAHPSAE
jgi:ASPIC and UnbV.